MHWDPRPDETLKTLKYILITYFDCLECREHIKAVFDTCIYGRCEWVPETRFVRKNTTFDKDGNFLPDRHDGLIMYLWRFHNAVTLRTAVKRTIDSYDGKYNAVNGVGAVSYIDVDVRFPPRSRCPTCYTNDEGMPITRELLLDYPKYKDIDWDRSQDFNATEIIRFLNEFYWDDNWNVTYYSILWSKPKQKFLYANTYLRRAADAITYAEVYISANSPLVVFLCVCICLYVFGFFVRSVSSKPCIHLRIMWRKLFKEAPISPTNPNTYHPTGRGKRMYAAVRDVVTAFARFGRSSIPTYHLGSTA